MSNIKEFEGKKLYLSSHTNKIKDTLSKTTNDFMYIGFLLWEIKEYEYYADDYKSIFDYSDKELRLGKTSTKYYIRLVEEYSERTKHGAMTFKLADKYKLYNYVQLVEMLSLPSELKDHVSPDMSQREIKEIKKEFKKKGQALDSRNVLELIIPTNENELRCENCGNSYFVDKENKKQWITIMGKKVFSCCYKIHWDFDLLNNDKRG